MTQDYVCRCIAVLYTYPAAVIFTDITERYIYYTCVLKEESLTWRTLAAALPGRTVGRGMGSCHIWPETHCKALSCLSFQCKVDPGNCGQRDGDHLKLSKQFNKAGGLGITIEVI